MELAAVLVVELAAVLVCLISTNGGGVSLSGLVLAELVLSGGSMFLAWQSHDEGGVAHLPTRLTVLADRKFTYFGPKYLTLSETRIGYTCHIRDGL